MSVVQTGQVLEVPKTELAGLEAHTALSASPLATRYLPKSKKTYVPRPSEVQP